MDASLTSPVKGTLPDGPRRDALERAERPSTKPHEGNFVTGCMVGGAIATMLWAAIGFAAYLLS